MKLRLIAAIILAAPSLALAALGLPANLEKDANTAFEDINKAKVALNGGDTKGAQQSLDKSKGLLGSVVQQSGGSQQGQKSTMQQAEGAVSQQTGAGTAGLKKTLDQVTSADSLLKSGEVQKAKGILDKIPSSPEGLLKGL
jgi:hypothetical protein